MRARRLALALLVPALFACGGPDAGQAHLCERLIPALEEPGVDVQILDRRPLPGGEPGVRVDYRAGGGPATRERTIACRFAGRAPAEDRLRLAAVEHDRRQLSPLEVFMLRRFWLDRYEPSGPRAGTAGQPSLERHLVHGLQLALNALSVAGIYGLLATGYTLVFALIGRINLAFGAMAVITAYVAFNGIMLSVAAGGVPPGLLLPLLMLVAVGFAATLGLAVERVLFRPLAGARSQAPLIASLGFAIALEEAVRLLQGTGERWLQPVLGDPLQVAGTGGFAATITGAQLASVGIAGLSFLALAGGLRWTGFGRKLRAAADDPLMAALCGVRTHRLMAVAFALSGALAGTAGCLVLLRYGVINAHDGWLLGFKALTAAVVGGIGSVHGAILGAVLIAAIEAAWATWFSLAWRDVAIFALLCLTLVLRPEGLLGRPLPPIARGP